MRTQRLYHRQRCIVPFATILLSLTFLANCKTDTTEGQQRSSGAGSNPPMPPWIAVCDCMEHERCIPYREAVPCENMSCADDLVETLRLICEFKAPNAVEDCIEFYLVQAQQHVQQLGLSAQFYILKHRCVPAGDSCGQWPHICPSGVQAWLEEPCFDSDPRCGNGRPICTPVCPESQGCMATLSQCQATCNGQWDYCDNVSWDPNLFPERADSDCWQCRRIIWEPAPSPPEPDCATDGSCEKPVCQNDPNCGDVAPGTIPNNLFCPPQQADLAAPVGVLNNLDYQALFTIMENSEHLTAEQIARYDVTGDDNVDCEDWHVCYRLHLDHTAAPGDINGDGNVDAIDMNIHGVASAQDGPHCRLTGDLNDDGVVDAIDLNEIGANWHL